MSSHNPFFFVSLVSHVFVMGVSLAGLVMALGRWSRHPQVSLWAAIGFGLLLANRAASMLFSVFLPFLAQRLGGGESVRDLNLAFTFFLGLVSAAALGALIAAVFGWRQQPAGPRR